MEEKCAMLLFLAHPALSPRAHGESPECGGTFACPASHPDVLHFLDEVLGREGLARVQTGERMEFSLAADWGTFEDLKAPLREKGYALRLMRMPPRS